jgi:hypothetical protein
MPAPDSIKDQQSHLHALALKSSSQSTASNRAVKPPDDPLSQERINARVNQPSSTLENILHRREPVPRFGINE